MATIAGYAALFYFWRSERASVELGLGDTRLLSVGLCAAFAVLWGLLGLAIFRSTNYAKSAFWVWLPFAVFLMAAPVIY